MDISRNLKRHRVVNGLSQKELADTIHVSQQTVSNWERGVGSPDLDSSYAICDKLEISIDDLREDSNERNSAMREERDRNDAE